MEKERGMGMDTFNRFRLAVTAALVLLACQILGTPAASAVRLAVQTQNGTGTFKQAGDVIPYNYLVTNTGAAPLAGPVLVTDASRQVSCPAVNTVGDLDNDLDPNETITCVAIYTVTPEDVSAGSITNRATAIVAGVRSEPAGLTLTLEAGQPGGALQLAMTANPQTYAQVGQIIIYTYSLTNSGATPLGPAQFTISDLRPGGPFPCGPDGTILAPAQSLSCSASYTVTQLNMQLPELKNSAWASGAGQTSAGVGITVPNLALPMTPGLTPWPSVTLVPGMTVQHEVMEGEWLIQIARCYGANLGAVQNANPEIADPEATLPPPMTITIPAIGSEGRVHGPPCLTYYLVEAGDTWESIANRHRIERVDLQDANRDVPLASGVRLRVPLYTLNRNPYPPGYDPAIAQRIQLTVGGSPLAFAGVGPPSGRIWYVVALTETQLLHLKLTGTAEALRLTVYDTYGEAYNPTPWSLDWTGFIPATGDYYIEVTELRGANPEPYTLEASLTLVVSSPTP
jgi:uncharacterized repeat protein (TIGR01451 family)